MAAEARWSVPNIDEQDAAALAKRCGLEMPAARVLWRRGFRDARAVDQFLHPRLSDLDDPFLLQGVETAVERVRAAVRGGERILIYGDYDVDGTSSIVILKKMLELLGGEADFHVPDRLRDGYGIQTHVLERAAAEGVRLIISVDTGIRAVEALKKARELGIDVIVTDHHLPEAELPPAVAILNPNQAGCAYPNKNLCGAGVTFKLIHALMEREGWSPDKIVRYSDSLLVLVAIATVADVVPLVGENRVIVKRGLEGLMRTKNPGLRALMKESRIEAGEPISATDVGFRLAPRINAAGRMENASEVIELFLTQDEERARVIAEWLSALNAERQRTCDTIAEQINEGLAEQAIDSGRAGLVLYNPEWHRGVVGIVASRIVERYNRPVLVLGRDETTGLVQGSGRSIPEFHLLDALESMGDLFVKFGGHRSAVGLTLEEGRVPELAERFNAYAMKALSADDLVALRDFDAEISLGELTDAAAGQVLQLAPFGLGNRQPTFLVRGVELPEPPRPLGKDGAHLMVPLPTGNGRPIFAKAWRFGERAGEVAAGSYVDLALSIDADNYSLRRGYSGWTATIRDVRPATRRAIMSA